MNDRALGLILIVLAIAFLLTGCGVDRAVFDEWQLDEQGCWQVKRTFRNIHTLEVVKTVDYTPLNGGVPICQGIRNAQ